MLHHPPRQQERALPSALGFALSLIRIVAPLILALLIRPGFRSCVMAPVPLKGNSPLGNDEGGTSKTTFGISTFFCFGRFGTLTQHRVQKPDILLIFRAYKGKRALALLAASQHFLPELLTITRPDLTRGAPRRVIIPPKTLNVMFRKHKHVI